jgi:hypothetical protein
VAEGLRPRLDLDDKDPGRSIVADRVTGESDDFWMSFRRVADRIQHLVDEDALDALVVTASRSLPSVMIDSDGRADAERAAGVSPRFRP